MCPKLGRTSAICTNGRQTYGNEPYECNTSEQPPIENAYVAEDKSTARIELRGRRKGVLVRSNSRHTTVHVRPHEAVLGHYRCQRHHHEDKRHPRPHDTTLTKRTTPLPKLEAFRVTGFAAAALLFLGRGLYWAPFQKKKKKGREEARARCSVFERLFVVFVVAFCQREAILEEREFFGPCTASGEVTTLFCRSRAFLSCQCSKACSVPDEVLHKHVEVQADRISGDVAASNFGLGGASRALDASLTAAQVDDPFASAAKFERTLEIRLFFYNGFMLSLLFFELLEIPFRIAFMDSPYSSPYPLGYFFFAAIVDWVFVADFALRFFLPYLHVDGHYVRGPPEKIRIHYVHGWCFPMAMAAIPWDFIWICLYGTSPVLGAAAFWLKYCRLTRTVRLPEIFTRVSEWEVALPFDVSPIVYRSARIILGTLLWVSAGACIIWLIAASERLPWSWNVSDDAAFAPVLQSVWIQYLSSLYFAVLMFSTVGFGDNNGSTLGERIFITIYALFSIGVMAYATGNVVTWLQSTEAKRTALADKLEEMKAYIRHRRMDGDLGDKVLRFHRFRGLNPVYGREDSELLGELSGALRVKVCRYFRSTIFQNWALPTICDTLFLTSMVMRMHRETRFPGEVITQQGSSASRFYLLTSGHAKVIKDGVEVMEVTAKGGNSPGVCLGERALFDAGARRPSTIQAIESCDLLFLKRKDLVQLIELFPEHSERVEAYGVSLCESHRGNAMALVQEALHSQGMSPIDGGMGSDKGKQEHAEGLPSHEGCGGKPIEGGQESFAAALGDASGPPRLSVPGGATEAGLVDSQTVARESAHMDSSSGKSPRPERASAGSPRLASPHKADKSPRLGGGFFRRKSPGVADAASRAPSRQEVETRVMELPEIPVRLFKVDILNDPAAVAKVLRATFREGTVLSGRDYVDWFQSQFQVSRPDAVYGGQRMLRFKAIYALDGSYDMQDSEKRFKVLGDVLSQSRLLNLLDTDVAGGIILTDKMERLILDNASPSSVADLTARVVSPVKPRPEARLRTLRNPAFRLDLEDLTARKEDDGSDGSQE